MTVPDERVAEYLAKAEDCRLEAKRAAHDNEKAAWLRMAEEWLRLSQGVERSSELDERLKTHVDGNIYPVHPKIIIR